MTLTKPERLPDLLRDRTGAYFEADGLCFAPLLETTAAGACVWALYFQNRFAGRAAARVRVFPPRSWFGHDLPAPSFCVDCPGGAFGVARALFPIPAAYQGRQISFRLDARVSYPDGRGELLRFRAGVPVSSRVRATLTLPQGVAETARADGGSTEIIW